MDLHLPRATDVLSSHLAKMDAVVKAWDEGCLWVFWVDNDAVITNKDLRLEDLVRAAHADVRHAT